MSSSIRLRTALKAARPSGARIHSIVEDIVSDDGDCSDVRVRGGYNSNDVAPTLKENDGFHTAMMAALTCIPISASYLLYIPVHIR